MSDNFREFDLALKSFGRKTVPEAVGDFRDAVALEALRGMVLLTDVDTGRARGNYQTTVGQPAVGDRNVTDISGKGDEGASAVDTVTEGAAVIAGARDPFAPIWIHNGLDYVVYLNDGTAKIPARHMLEQTVQRLKRRFG